MIFERDFSLNELIIGEKITVDISAKNASMIRLIMYKQSANITLEIGDEWSSCRTFAEKL